MQLMQINFKKLKLTKNTAAQDRNRITFIRLNAFTQLADFLHQTLRNGNDFN